MRGLRLTATIVAVLIAVLAISACGGSDDGGSSASTTGGGERQVRVGMVFKSLDPYYSVAADFAERAAAENPDVDLTIAAGNTGVDTDVQIQKVQDLLAKGVDVLVVSPSGPGLEPILQRAVDQGVKVLLFDNDLPGWEDRTAYIGTNLPNGSRLAGEYMLSRLRSGDQVGIMVGIPGLPAAVDRYTTAQRMLEDAGIETNLTTKADNCTQDLAVRVAQDLLVAHPDLDAIYAICGPQALGMDQVVNSRQGGKPILRVGFDGLRDEAKAILDGKQDASIAQFAGNLGTYGVRYAVMAAQGETIPERIDTGTELVTRANASEFLQPH